jgi:hypothetical protein
LVAPSIGWPFAPQMESIEILSQILKDNIDMKATI